MGLSQAVLNQMGRQAFAMYGGLRETVTVLHRTTRAGTPTTHTGLTAYVSEYKEAIVAIHMTLERGLTFVQREDRQLQLLVEDVTWTPNAFGTFVRADGTTWFTVETPSGGAGRSFWTFHIRRVPT